MEGASLFEKADGMGYRSGRFFYSRRIGEEISFNEGDYINANEELIRYDNKPELINSTKISGTTDNKLSIEVYNGPEMPCLRIIKKCISMKTAKDHGKTKV